MPKRALLSAIISPFKILFTVLDGMYFYAFCYVIVMTIGLSPALTFNCNYISHRLENV